MDVLKNFEVFVDEKIVFRLLGYKEAEPDEEIIEAVREEIKRCNEYIMPSVAYQRIGIKNIRNDSVELDNGVVFQGEFISKKLKDCSYVIVGVTTIGGKLDEEVKNAFDSGDYLMGMIIDHIGTSAVEYVNKTFWNDMVDSIKNTTIGITSRLSPGDTDWNMHEQRKIFDCLKEKDTGVVLSESYMMIPFKSTSYVYGFGEGIGIAKSGHVCADCSMKRCAYRMDERKELIVHHNGNKDIIDVKPGSNLLEVLRHNNFFISNPCGGSGFCGKCRVKVMKGISVPSLSDTKHLSLEELKKGIRLSCNIILHDNLEIELYKEEEKIKVLTYGEELSINPQSNITKKYCKISPPTLEDQRDDVKRLEDAVGISRLSIRQKDLTSLSDKLRKAKFDITATLNNDRLLHIEEGNTEDSKFGVAVDIGTTTIACYLLNLNSGNTIDVISDVNMQRAYGSDVISRINYTIDHEDGLSILRECIVEQINGLIETLCDRNAIQVNNVYDTVIVGNTTMIHLFLGLPCRNIALAPYIPVTNSYMEYEAIEVGIRTNGVVSFVPGISAYVGSDITSGIISSGMLKSEKFSILLDLGTNGEIALGNKDEVITCSTAAGPAFEGANIKCGIGGVRGAISKIDFSNEKIYETIGNAKACGICGSGVLDALAQLVKKGIVDETGRMVDCDEIDDEGLKKRLIKIDNMKAVLLEENSLNGEKIVFTQKDVREVQLAKAAIGAGINILLIEKGIKIEDVETLYIGGGFGNYMDIESSVLIGMIPSELKGRIKSIGNCAGTGAKMFMLSKDFRCRAEELIKRTEYIELSKRADFQEYFIEFMML